MNTKPGPIPKVSAEFSIINLDIWAPGLYNGRALKEERENSAKDGK
jgi:hypothetical protein